MASNSKYAGNYIRKTILLAAATAGFILAGCSSPSWHYDGGHLAAKPVEPQAISTQTVYKGGITPQTARQNKLYLMRNSELDKKIVVEYASQNRAPQELNAASDAEHPRKRLRKELIRYLGLENLIPPTRFDIYKNSTVQTEIRLDIPKLTDWTNSYENSLGINFNVFLRF